MNTTQPATGTILPITPLLRDLAALFARQRMKDHQNRSAAEDRGSSDANYQADFYGCLAELAVALEIEAQRVRLGLPCEDGFFRKGAADLRLGDRLIEIKAVPPGKRYCCLNAAQHKRTDPVTWYLPVLFTSDESALRLMRPVSHSAAGRWDLRADRHAPYLSTNVCKLLPLHSLEGLCRAA